MIGIYCIKNQKTNWNYIGSSVSIFNRWKQHSKELNEGKHHCHRLQCAWDSDGATNFTFSILEICDEEILLQKEQEWIDKLYNDGCIYNTKVKIIDNKQSLKQKNKTKIIDENIFFIEGMEFDKLSLRTGRILVYILYLAKKHNSTYIEVSVGEFCKYMDVFSSRVYEECDSLYKLELDMIKVDGENMFENIEYDNGILIVNLHTNILGKIKSNKTINTNIHIKQLKHTTNHWFIKFLILMTKSNLKLEMTVDDMRANFCYKNQYSRYCDLKAKLIKKIQEDFNKINKELKIKENKIGRCVHSIEFELK